MKASRAFERRYERMSAEEVCGSCGFCDGKLCAAYRVPLRSYSGIRLTADGFDCALPVTIDSHSACSYGCLYCFSEQLYGHIETKAKPLGQTSLTTIERVFAGEGGQDAARIRKALKYDRRNADGYPCPVQLGGINDPFDDIERQQGWALRFMDLAIRYRQPVRISTKGIVISEPDYLKKLAEAPHLFWVAWSINTPDDDLAKVVDARAPSPSWRLEAMKKVSALGCKTSLRMRPILPGLSDRTKRHPRAYAELIERAAEAGAYAISYEVGFVPTRMTAVHREKWQRMERAIGVPLTKVYGQLGEHQSCLRPSFAWTEDIMHGIHETAKRRGLSVGVSDPVWKQLNDWGCCCGMKPGDQVFGNWQREQATNALVEARDGRLPVIRMQDCTPAWAYDTPYSAMVYPGAGPRAAWVHRHYRWSDKLIEQWNDPQSERGPFLYFQGALRVAGTDGEGNLTYKYEGLKRAFPERTPYWVVEKRPSNGKTE
jgi:DNA repair photolyase